MPSLALADLCARRPDGSVLFDRLSVALGPGLTALVGDNGAGKSTLLSILAGEVAPAAGTVVASGPVRRLRQAEDDGASVAGLFGAEVALGRLRTALAGAAEDTTGIDWTLDDRIARALAGLGLDGVGPERRLGTLSGGQRQRAALAALFFDAPDIVLLDEPSNDLDAAGRALLAERLAAFPGVALVASHDRDLLGRAERILALTGTGPRLFGGGFAGWQAAEAAAAGRAEAELGRAREAAAEAERRARAAAERKARSDRQGRRLRASGSHGKMLMDMEKQRAENSASGASRQDARARAAAAERLEAAEAGVAPARAMRFELPPSTLPAARRVLEMQGATVTRGALRLGPLDLVVTGPERIALTGPNGIGKSTALALASGRVAPDAGRVRRSTRLALLDQSLGLLSPDRTLLESFAEAHPEAGANGARAALARFHFRADRGGARPGDLSGGERLRAGLALVFGGETAPEVLILDEPTNHLDLSSRELLEAALAGFDGALVVVSHDADFVAALAPTRRVALSEGPGGRVVIRDEVA